MTPKDASAEARKNLRLLAGELGVSLKGIPADDLEIVAIRFVMGGLIHTELQAIVDDVRDGMVSSTGTDKSGSPVSLASRLALSGAEGGGQATVADEGTQEPAPSSTPPHRGMHYLATEATAAKMRHRLRLAHQAEDSRAALYIVPRRPEALPVDKPHPACLVSARERHGTVCQRCSWLLDDDPYTDAWLDRDDSTGGRL